LPYKDQFLRYRCEFTFDDPNYSKIKKILISLLGEPKQEGLLHPFEILNMKGEEIGEGFQLTLTSENIAELHKKCLELNISFEKIFERDWCHLHLTCYLGDDEDLEDDTLFHEGIAYENEEYWAMYYEDGSLNELPELIKNQFFIQNIYKRDINDPNIDIPILFEKWVREHYKHNRSK
jgi:hypothetical protein